MFEPMTEARLKDIREHVDYYKQKFSDRKRVFNANLVSDLLDTIDAKEERIREMEKEVERLHLLARNAIDLGLIDKQP